MHTDARNIAGAGEDVNISHRDPGNSACPSTATAISMGASLMICSLKNIGMHQLTYLSRSGMVCKARKENLGKICDDS